MLKAISDQRKTDRLAEGLARLGLFAQHLDTPLAGACAIGPGPLICNSLAYGLVLFAPIRVYRYRGRDGGPCGPIRPRTGRLHRWGCGPVCGAVLYIGLLLYVGRGEFLNMPNEAWFSGAHVRGADDQLCEGLCRSPRHCDGSVDLKRWAGSWRGWNGYSFLCRNVSRLFNTEWLMR